MELSPTVNLLLRKIIFLKDKIEHIVQYVKSEENKFSKDNLAIQKERIMELLHFLDLINAQIINGNFENEREETRRQHSKMETLFHARKQRNGKKKCFSCV